MDKEAIIEVLRKHKEEWHNRYGITSLTLFGSMATDQATPDSDVDLIYEKEKTYKMTYQKYIAFIRELEAVLGRPVDLVFKDEIDPIIEYYARESLIPI